MGKLLVNTLAKDIEVNVKNPHMVTIAMEILERCNDLNATEAASSSGKYHPIADLGYQGLVRHSRMVAELATIMARSIPTYDNELDHDIIYLSAILHDMCKYQEASEGDKGYTSKDNIHTNFDHPIKMQALISEVVPKILAANNIHIEFEDKAKVEDAWRRIGMNIASHMSRWNTSKYAPGIELPLPQSLEQYIIVFADLISANAQLPETMQSMKNLAINFMTGRVKAE